MRLDSIQDATIDVNDQISIAGTKKKNDFVTNCFQLIAEHYDCMMTTRQVDRSNELLIILRGQKSNIEICKIALHEAYVFVGTQCQKIQSTGKKRSPAIIQKIQTAYMHGFREGLRGAPKKRDADSLQQKQDLESICRRHFIQGHKDGSKLFSSIDSSVQLNLQCQTENDLLMPHNGS